MALAETAKLVASLELQDKFSGRLGAANTSLNRFQTSMGTVGKGVGQLGAGVGRVAASLLKLGVAGGIALGAFVGVQIKAGIESLHHLELVTAQTNTVLASTKGVAGQTADSIRALSEKYETLNATIDDKVIQSSANLLLSFTNIRKDAFEPALQAALNVNQALGGGEEGLQANLIKVAKALNDPIKGLGLLGRVGITFTDQEKAKITALVKSNKLYEAQTVILDRLSTKFGGQFAAAGDTAAGRMALLRDNVDDLQQKFAGPFASVLDRIVGKLGGLLGEAGTVNAVTNLGQAIAGLFSDAAIDKGIGVLRSGLSLLSPSNLAKVGAAIGKAFDAVKGIPFDTIGKGLELTARVAKTAVDAFLSLPKEVQGIVVAGLAANKLSGGLIGSGLGNIAKGLGGLLTGGGLLGRGASPANPVWVQSVGGIGGGLPGAPGGFPPIGLGTLGIAGLLGAATVALIVGAEKESRTAAGQRAIAEHATFSHWGGIVDKNTEALQTNTGALKPFVGQLSGAPGGGHPINTANDVARELQARGRSVLPNTALGTEVVSDFHELPHIRDRLTLTAQLLRDHGVKLSQQIDNLRQIGAKDFSPKVNVNVQTTANISVSNIARSLYSFSSAASVRREFVEAGF